MSFCCDNVVLKVWFMKTSCLLSVLQKACACCVTYMYKMQQMFCDDLPLGGWRHLTSVDTKTKSSPHTVLAWEEDAYNNTLYHKVKHAAFHRSLRTAGTNSSSNPGPRSRALTGELTWHVWMVGKPEHNPSKHSGNTQKGWESNPGPSYREESVLTTEPTSCCIYALYLHICPHDRSSSWVNRLLCLWYRFQASSWQPQTTNSPQQLLVLLRAEMPPPSCPG